MFDALVTAETAPTSVQLWPTTTPEAGRNFTLESVEVITRTLRDASGKYDRAEVVWTYQNGHERTFTPGERVSVRVANREQFADCDVTWLDEVPAERAHRL